MEYSDAKIHNKLLKTFHSTIPIFHHSSSPFHCLHTLRFQVGGGNTNLPEMLLLKFLSLSDHHSHFWAATFDFTTFFMLPFLHGLHLFLQFGCFCVDIYSITVLYDNWGAHFDDHAFCIFCNGWFGCRDAFHDVLCL